MSNDGSSIKIIDRSHGDQALPVHIICKKNQRIGTKMDHNLINVQQNGVLNESEPLINQEIKMSNQKESRTNFVKDEVSSGITDFKHDFINFFKQNGLSDYWDYLLLFIRFIQSLLLLNGDVLGDYILATTYLE